MACQLDAWTAVVVGAGCIAIIAVFSANAGHWQLLQYSVALLVLFITSTLISQRYDLFGLGVPAEVDVDFQSIDPAKCIASGIKTSTGNVISVCAIQFRRELTFDVATSIIYDSTDEIGRISVDHPREWLAALNELSNKAPFHAFGFSASRITGHFYYVAFASYLDPINLANAGSGPTSEK